MIALWLKKLFIIKEFDIIILDVIIPGINGLELCKKIRNAEYYNSGINAYFLRYC